MKRLVLPSAKLHPAQGSHSPAVVDVATLHSEAPATVHHASWLSEPFYSCCCMPGLAWPFTRAYEALFPRFHKENAMPDMEKKKPSCGQQLPHERPGGARRWWRLAKATGPAKWKQPKGHRWQERGGQRELKNINSWRVSVRDRISVGGLPSTWILITTTVIISGTGLLALP